MKPNDHLIEHLTVDGESFHYYSLGKLAANFSSDGSPNIDSDRSSSRAGSGQPPSPSRLDRLPRSIRILLENILLQSASHPNSAEDIEALLNWSPVDDDRDEIQFMPRRVLLQDFTGVPVVADLAAMRSTLKELGGDEKKIRPLQPVDLVIDHSVQVDFFGTKQALELNSKLEFERNRERYEFLKWAQDAFTGFNVVPPATGICHQVNLEYLAQVAFTDSLLGGKYKTVGCDSLVGTDSHTPMINGLGVLGWGVGGIEAEAAMLGQPCSMLIPDVIGIELFGSLKPGVTATDLVLTITELLRRKNVVGKFVEFTGAGVSSLSIADRATISNMAPEYGATVGLWPVDAKTVEYLKLTGRGKRANLVEVFFKAQGLWHESDSPRPEFTELLTFDLSAVEASVAGPAKPHDRVALPSIANSFRKFSEERRKKTSPQSVVTKEESPEKGRLADGNLVIAAITSCTNTSNPTLMIGAGLLAKKAVEKGLKVPSWVKTSFAPGSKVVTEYLRETGLDAFLDQLGFNLVGYGCTTCIGNSGPLSEEISEEILARDLTVAAVLSGNRNFEARIHQLVRANYLASPPLVVAFALAGRIDVNLLEEPLGLSQDGKAVFLRDIWPSAEEVDRLRNLHVTPQQFQSSYADVFQGSELWRALSITGDGAYEWKDDSSYIRRPPFVAPLSKEESSSRRQSLNDCRVLAIFGDFITTDHISPAGAISPKSPAGQYLTSIGVQPSEFNSYGSRRGNHEVMVRGTFANSRLRNLMIEDEGGWTVYWPSAEKMTIFEASLKYEHSRTPLVIFAGREYGSGSSRDWAAKGPRLLGVRAVIAETFERIHRSNLVGMGILPLEIKERTAELNLKGNETIDLMGLEAIRPRGEVSVVIHRADGTNTTLKARARIDTPNEFKYYLSGGILPYMMERFNAPC